MAPRPSPARRPPAASRACRPTLFVRSRARFDHTPRTRRPRPRTALHTACSSPSSSSGAPAPPVRGRHRPCATMLGNPARVKVTRASAGRAAAHLSRTRRERVDAFVRAGTVAPSSHDHPLARRRPARDPTLAPRGGIHRRGVSSSSQSRCATFTFAHLASTCGRSRRCRGPAARQDCLQALSGFDARRATCSWAGSP